MRRRARAKWVAGAVLFGLLAPMCALACLNDAAPPVPIVQHADAEMPPCHAPDEPDAGKSEPADDCSCRPDGEALAGQLDSKARSQGAFLLPVSDLRGALRLAHALSFNPARMPRVPPPDILLLKSTLIL